jgi:hypothetical protein
MSCRHWTAPYSLATLTREVLTDTIKMALEIYGKIHEIRDEMWSPLYRYKVRNDIRIITTELKGHIPAHIYIVGHRTILSTRVNWRHVIFVMQQVTYQNNLHREP